MASLMTGNANTMTIPQIKKTITLLNEKLKDDRIKGNDTLTAKINNLIYDYTKAQNKILRYYEKTKSRHPELVAGKKNTLTLVQIYRNQGKEGKANKFAQKEQKWAYNVADFMKDTKGYAVGIAATAGVLGVANLITTKIAQKGALELLGAALGKAFMASPVTTSLIAAGVAIGGLCIVVPKIARSVQRIKANKTRAREINNEVLEAASEGELDMSTQTVDEIKEVLKSNRDLKERIENGTFDWASAGFTPLERSKIMRAFTQLNAELTQEERDNFIEVGKQRTKDLNYETYLQAYIDASHDVPASDVITLQTELTTLTSNINLSAKQGQITRANNLLENANTELENKKTARASAEAAVTLAMSTYTSDASAANLAALQTAQRNLQSAEAAVTTAEAAVVAAQEKVTIAQNRLADAQNQIAEKQQEIAKRQAFDKAKADLAIIGLTTDADIAKAVENRELEAMGRM